MKKRIIGLLIYTQLLFVLPNVFAVEKDFNFQKTKQDLAFLSPYITIDFSNIQNSFILNQQQCENILNFDKSEQIVFDLLRKMLNLSDNQAITTEMIKHLQNEDFAKLSFKEQNLFLDLLDQVDYSDAKIDKDSFGKERLGTKSEDFSQAPSILALACPNALDFNIQIQELDNKLNITNLSAVIGGKAINAAKTLVRFGRKVEIIGFNGQGKVGEKFNALLKTKGIENISFVKTKTDTRLNPMFFVKTQDENIEKRILVPGGKITEQEEKEFWQNFEQILQNSHVGQFLLIGGRIPPGLSDDFWCKVITKAKQKKIKCEFDFSISLTDEQIAITLSANPYIIKPNLEELAKITKTDISQLQNDFTIIKKARELNKQGIEIVIVSLGKAGSILITKDLVLRAKVPEIDSENTVGAGDSFIGGFVHMLSLGKNIEEAYSFASAVGTATCLYPQVETVNLNIVDTVRSKIKISSHLKYHVFIENSI
ncbi:MAG: PfkB family carbohydrate kinase [Candidatus Omnitrophota bacterium]